MLLLFGVTKLPKIAKSMGEAIRGFKKSVKDEDEEKKEEGEEKKNPPDVLTEIALAIPFIILFEISLLAAWIMQRRG